MEGEEAAVAPAGVPPEPSPPAESPEEVPDARIYLVRRDASGNRHRLFETTVQEMIEEEFGDWPLEGPRTCLWALRGMAKWGNSPNTAFVRFRSDLLSQVKGNDVSTVLDHELMHELAFLHAAVQVGLRYDQLQLANLALGELILRRIQQLRHAMLTNKLKPKVEHESLFLGNGKESAGVVPQLMHFIADKLRDEQKLLKERRLLREEEKGKK